MKIIDLFNKIANGEEVPKKVSFAGIIFEYDEDDQMYSNDEYENELVENDVLGSEGNE